jgi:hypothetical protein
MAHVDLDAKRAARSEARNQPHSFTLDGEEYELPARIPLEVLELIGEGLFRSAFEQLLRRQPGKAERFFATDPPPDDEDLEALLSVYGSPGNSSASQRSSRSTGQNSKRTSKAPTD